jgi:hypothetical protein
VARDRPEAAQTASQVMADGGRVHLDRCALDDPLPSGHDDRIPASE